MSFRADRPEMEEPAYSRQMARTGWYWQLFVSTSGFHIRWSSKSGVFLRIHIYGIIYLPTLILWTLLVVQEIFKFGKAAQIRFEDGKLHAALQMGENSQRVRTRVSIWGLCRYNFLDRFGYTAFPKTWATTKVCRILNTPPSPKKHKLFGVNAGIIWLRKRMQNRFISRLSWQMLSDVVSIDCMSMHV